jgi:MFS family permease
MADSSLPESHFSAIYGGATLAGAALQFKWGRLIDRYGSRIALPCFILILGLGLAAITACGAHLGPANYPLLFIGFTAIRTTAIGALDNVTNTTVAQWFDKRRGRAMTGMIFTQELLTSSLYAQLAQHFTATRGWRWTNRAASLGCCGLAVVSALLVWHTPEEVGLAPDGKPTVRPASYSVYDENATAMDGQEQEQEQEQEALLKGDDNKSSTAPPVPTPVQGDRDQAPGRSDYTVQQARRHIGLWLLALNIGCFGFCWAATDFYLLAIVAANTGQAVGSGVDLATTYYFPQVSCSNNCCSCRTTLRQMPEPSDLLTSSLCSCRQLGLARARYYSVG